MEQVILSKEQAQVLLMLAGQDSLRSRAIIW